MMRDPICEKYHQPAKALRVYVPCWPWDGEMCDECGRTCVDWGWLKSAAWSVLIGWWWDGRMRVPSGGER